MQNSTQTKQATHQPENVGRKYQKVRYGVHSRRVGGDGTWYGTSAYKTLEAAKEGLRAVGTPICDGMVSFGDGKKEKYEYRIVREIAEVEVLHLETKAL